MKKEVTPSRNDAIHVTGSQTSAEAVRPPSQLRFVPRGAIDNDTNPLNQASFDLGAPGEEIFSCAHTTDISYKFLNGTSMAAPHVVGACALLWPRYPATAFSQPRTHLPSLAGKCVTGGRLNLQTALLSTNGITSNSANGPLLSSPAATTDVK